MKTIHYLYFYTIVAFALSSCITSSATSDANMNTPVALLTATTVPIATMTLEAMPTIPPMLAETMTPLATLEPGQAKNTIRTLLYEPVDCSAPCFWGITPSQTTLSEATNIFSHLGLQTWRITRDNTDYYGVTNKFDSGLSIMPVLTIQNDIVKDISVDITPGIHQKAVSREWLAYSPEALIKRYGLPSRVDFAIAWGPSTSSNFQMVMYFDTVDLIVEYGGQDIIPWQQKGSPQVCPLVEQFEIVRIWMGKNPVYPPAHAIPLEDAVGMTMKEFSQLITGNPDRACFKLKGEMFP
jgi:hypothetical protein